MLYRLWRKQARVSVTIRRLKGIRGVCTGALVAFDKHFNIVLRDVVESYCEVVLVPHAPLDAPPGASGQAAAGAGADAADDAGDGGGGGRWHGDQSDGSDDALAFGRQREAVQRVELARTRRLAQLFIAGASVVLVCKAAKGT